MDFVKSNSSPTVHTTSVLSHRALYLQCTGILSRMGSQVLGVKSFPLPGDDNGNGMNPSLYAWMRPFEAFNDLKFVFMASLSLALKSVLLLTLCYSTAGAATRGLL
jgi:hypothetical protein